MVDMRHLHQLSDSRILQVFAWIQEMYFSVLNKAATKDFRQRTHYLEEKVSKIYTKHSSYFSTQLMRKYKYSIYCNI